MAGPSVILPVVLTPDEEAELRHLAAEAAAAPGRLHRRLVELYLEHKDDETPASQEYLGKIVGLTQQRVAQIIRGAE